MLFILDLGDSVGSISLVGCCGVVGSILAFKSTGYWFELRAKSSINIFNIIVHKLSASCDYWHNKYVSK